jgi:peptidoglycan/xylan/chitin deacetylase (PgdA/CDA1 family)
MSVVSLNSIAVPATLATCAALGGAAYATVAPGCSFWGPVVYRGEAARSAGRYALTFDDGPTEESTPRVLDALAELGAKATFFCIGANARRNPGIVRRIHDEGHVVGNHTFDHSHFGVMRRQRYWDDQVGATDELLASILGVKPALFRPPMGMRTPHVTWAARRYGYTVVTWTRRAFDSRATTPARIVGRLAGPTAAGDILILHDGIEPNHERDPGASVAAVAPLVRALRERGLEPGTLEELTGVQPYAGVPV